MSIKILLKILILFQEIISRKPIIFKNQLKKYNCNMKNKVLHLLVCLCGLFTLMASVYVELPYADWAHSHVVWYNNTQNQQKILQMAETYMKNQIPFGGFNIDSGWSTCYNDFIWNSNLFPDPQGLINYFHSKNIKVMLWATSVINDNCPNYQQAKQKGYLLNNGKTIKWWHGHGAFIDFFNPEATKWWKTQMDKVLDMGIDAWKCDGTDPMTMLLRPWPYSSHKKRFIKPWDYSHRYYGTFYNYTKQRNVNALIMARPVDSFHEKVFYPYAPKYVMFSGWVGDQDASPSGLRQALANVMHSAWKGYLNFGFDIGGYRGNKMRIQKNVFVRWAQVGSMVPFMENGGNGLHEPWAFDQQVVDIYRKFVLIHYDLKSFFLSAGSEAYREGKAVIEPLAKKQDSVSLSYLQSYGYKLWDTFLVFPIFESNNIAEMMIPEGTWVYYFNHSYIIDKRVQARAFSLDEFPIFIKKGSIYPVQREYLELDYMRQYKQSNPQLPMYEIVLVYPHHGLHNKTFLHKSCTDYLTLHYNSTNFHIRVDRFYKNELNQTLKSFNNYHIAIRIIGALKTSALKISYQNQQEIIAYKYDENPSQDLIFDIETNTSYELSNLHFKNIQITL